MGTLLVDPSVDDARCRRESACRALYPTTDESFQCHCGNPSAAMLSLSRARGRDQFVLPCLWAVDDQARARFGSG